MLKSKKDEASLRNRSKKIRGCVLFIDDVPDTHFGMSVVLKNQGFEVSVASSGKEGMQKALTLRPDLILLDIDMPGYSGVDVLERLRKYSKTKHIPVIMITGMTEIQTVKQVQKLGVSGYVSKPYDISDLLVRIKKVLKGRL